MTMAIRQLTNTVPIVPVTFSAILLTILPGANEGVKEKETEREKEKRRERGRVVVKMRAAPNRKAFSAEERREAKRRRKKREEKKKRS